MNLERRGAFLLGAITAAILLFAAAHSPRAETITWNNAAGGNWSLAGNWNPADIPNEAGEDALVANDDGTYTITLNVSPSLDAVAIQNPNATLNLGAYSLTFLQAAGLNNAGTVRANSGSAMLAGPVYNGPSGHIQTANSCNLTFPGPLIANDGVITINVTGGTGSSNLIFSGNVDLSGSGTLRMTTTGQINDAEVETSPGMVLTQQAGHSIRGGGTILGNVTNYGTIMADEAAHALTLNTNPKTNHGTIGAAAGSYLDVASITLTQGPGGQLVGDEGVVRLTSGATLIGGTLASNGAGSVSMTSGTATLEDVRNTGAFTVLPGTVYLRGTLTTNDGTITLNPAGSSGNAFLTFTGNTTFGGSGECVLVAATGANDANINTGAGVVGTNGPGHTIRGSGTISAALTNEGVISGDDPVRSLDLVTNPKTNRALMQAIDAGRLDIVGCAVTQDPGATILADSAVVGLATAASITGGILATAHGGILDAYNGTVTLQDVTQTGSFGIRGEGMVTIAGSSLTNDGTITVNSNNSGSNAVLHAANDAFLQGAGTVRMKILNLVNDASITTAPGATLTHAAGHTIRGAGQIHGAVANEGLICADDPVWNLELRTSPKTNRSELRAEGGGVMLITGIAVTQEGNGRIVADGALAQLSGAAIEGGTLSTANDGAVRVILDSSLTGTRNLGTLQIDGSNALTIHGAEFANAGLIEINYRGDIYNSCLTFAEDATLVGAGQVRMRAVDDDPDDAAIRALGSAHLTIGPDQIVHGAGGLFARLTNLGTILADDASGRNLSCVSDSLVNLATMRAENGGDLVVTSGRAFNLGTMAAVDTSRIVATSGTLLNQSEVTTSDGGILLVQSAGRLVNEGLITAGPGGRFDMTDGTTQNHGTVRSASQGVVRIDYGEYRSDGRTEVAAGGSFWSDRMSASGHYSGTTLSGGIWQVEAGGSMRLIGCNVQTLAAGAVLIGPGAVIHRDEGATDALANLQRIVSGGHLETRAGRDYETAGNLACDSGELTVGAGCAFTVHGQYAQSGNGEIGRGVTTVNGTLQSDAGSLSITGGVLRGNGTVLDHVNNSGWIAPGVSIGTLTLAGHLAALAEGTVEIELGGTAPGESDLLRILGTANLAGRLVVRSAPGYTPLPGDRFAIVRCGTRNGQFNLETGCPGPELSYQTEYYTDRVEIVIVATSPSAVPDPENGTEIAAEEDPEDDPDAQQPGVGDDGLSNETAEALPTEARLSAQLLGEGACSIRLALPQAAEVDARLFDLTGRQVAVLCAGPRPAGVHAFEWKGATAGSRLASGVYLACADVRAEGGTTRLRARVLLIR